jgi:serine/threonine protein kinase
VYKVFDFSGRAYAVKEVSTEQRFRRRESHSIEEQIRSEITMLGQCNHKNVLRLVEAYEVETIKDTFYLVTEPWAPTTLRDFLTKLSRDGITSPCTWWIADEGHDIVLQICQGLIDGLSYLHDHSIKHKDIKPENLLLHCPPYGSGQTPRVLPVIADFGISKIYRRGAQTMFTGATVEYLAPEQINHVESGLKADVFSMGCCFLLLFAAVCEGGKGVERIEDVVIDIPGSCQYGREIKRILPVLYEMISTIQQLREEPRARLTRLGLAVRDMLIEAPAKRLSTESVRHALVEGEGLLPEQVSLP